MNKAPFGGPQRVIQYLGRYTHKIAITSHRIISIDKEHTTFRYRDYADGHQEKQMQISNEEFLRRFEQHILPAGFVKIRHYGYLKNYQKKSRLEALFLQMNLPKRCDKIYIPVQVRLMERYGKDITKCPHCETGKMIMVSCYRPKNNDFKIAINTEEKIPMLQCKSPP